MSSNPNQVKISIINQCIGSQHFYCFLSSDHNFDLFYRISTDFVDYYLDNELFESEQVRDAYVDKIIKFDTETINFLKEKLRFQIPTEKIIDIKLLSSTGDGVSRYAGPFIILGKLTSQITSEDVTRLQQGNTHEYTHAFFGGIPLVRPFEEGLADFMSHLQSYGAEMPFQCTSTGWQEGYVDDKGEFIQNSPLVPYSDFTKNLQPTSDFYDPLNPSSYYRSCECFWIYIKEHFGMDALKNIVQTLDQTRILVTPPVHKLKFFKNVIFPILGNELKELARTRYHYDEDGEPFKAGTEEY